MSESSEPTVEQLQQVAVDRLAVEFADRVPPATIKAYVSDAVQAFQDAKVQQYVGVFVYRIARERLEALTEPPA
jgi:hypothetical protein